ncbi:hypothetical protein CORMATOL_00830 [Corynebacterium matruchotii ATCC 33806]|uniref:Uncharacterized protein n=1 Tax=Corynebacterium matruchotii ATCC 33806 TaxID=566549 RepID=C0E1H9_9CORY|nr:hypothetical protein CORMATOL_00830 [Corynebacterium matruchotii ATCC 33806]
MCDCFLMICLLWILLGGLHCKIFVLWLVVCFGDVSRETLLPHIFMASYGDG